MNVDRLIDQTFPSLVPNPPPPSFTTSRTDREKGSTGSAREVGAYRDPKETATKGRGGGLGNAGDSDSKRLKEPIDLRTTSSSFASTSTSTSSPASKLFSFFRTSSSAPKVIPPPPPPRADSTVPRSRTSTLESIPTRQSLSAASPSHVGQSPSSRPSTPTSSLGPRRERAATRDARGKTLSIFSISSSSKAKGGGGGCDGSDTASTLSSRYSTSLSQIASSQGGNPSPPLDAKVCAPTIAPSTPQRERSGSVTSSSTSSAYDSKSTPGHRPAPPSSSSRSSLRKTLSSLMLGGGGGGGGGSRSADSTPRNEDQGKRRRRQRTSSKGFGTESEDGDELTEEEIRSWRLSNSHERRKHEKKPSYASSSIDWDSDLASSFGSGGGRRRTSSNKSFLDGPDFSSTNSRTRSLSTNGDATGSDDDDDDEVLIIDRTKSKGFSTLLGAEYDQVIPRCHVDRYSPTQTPTAASFSFPQLRPPDSLPTTEISRPPSPGTPTVLNCVATPATLRPPPGASPSRPLSQSSANSEEALWLDASTTKSFPPSPLPPAAPPARTAPSGTTSKPIKQSVFATSLVNPAPPSPRIPSTPGGEGGGGGEGASSRRRASLIPLSPKVAQEQHQQLASGLPSAYNSRGETADQEEVEREERNRNNEVQARFAFPTDSRPDRVESAGRRPSGTDNVQENGQGGEIEGLLIKWNI